MDYKDHLTIDKNFRENSIDYYQVKGDIIDAAKKQVEKKRQFENVGINLFGRQSEKNKLNFSMKKVYNDEYKNYKEFFKSKSLKKVKKVIIKEESTTDKNIKSEEQIKFKFKKASNTKLPLIQNDNKFDKILKILDIRKINNHSSSHLTPYQVYIIEKYKKQQEISNRILSRNNDLFSISEIKQTIDKDIEIDKEKDKDNTIVLPKLKTIDNNTEKVIEKAESPIRNIKATLINNSQITPIRRYKAPKQNNIRAYMDLIKDKSAACDSILKFHQDLVDSISYNNIKDVSNSIRYSRNHDEGLKKEKSISSIINSLPYSFENSKTTILDKCMESRLRSPGIISQVNIIKSKHYKR